MTKQSTFLNLVKQGAEMGWSNYKVLPSLTGAQAALESGWGSAAISNNLFGIKADASWHGPVVTATTREYGLKGAYRELSKFRAYSSFSESTLDHAKFLHENKRYSNLLGEMDYHLVCTLIKKDGYATDPNYTQKLESIIETYQLYHWDPSEKESQSRQYIVKKGDTLDELAERFGRPLLELQKLNSIKDPNKIYVGQQLKI
ncbi:glucosaminidase domain-containing protein [Sporolactobacillus pectinivorans]|uniref:glucosaminidase domain-containing protein n=1 Tax=Sporolactobacillus pectinivorans TaxID=1591408 RepID=UPI000C2647E3|nr:glucosaminidase domain-containing protein [Sporolactobacillus pectinivorans]